MENKENSKKASENYVKKSVKILIRAVICPNERPFCLKT